MTYNWQKRQADYKIFNKRQTMSDGELALAWVKTLLTLSVVIAIGWALLIGLWVAFGA